MPTPPDTRRSPCTSLTSTGPSPLSRSSRPLAAALDRLNQRVVNQRFVLRRLDELGRSLSADELRATSVDAAAS